MLRSLVGSEMCIRDSTCNDFLFISKSDCCYTTAVNEALDGKPIAISARGYCHYHIVEQRVLDSMPTLHDEVMKRISSDMSPFKRN